MEEEEEEETEERKREKRLSLIVHAGIVDRNTKR